MRGLRTLCMCLGIVMGMAGSVFAEGFAMNEWSARGLSLAGGMVGRADDPSALAYNAAGITQLPGLQVLGGAAFIAPMGTVVGEFANGRKLTTQTKPATWMAPHAYASYQLNDSFWLGLGVFSRFGLGNSFDGKWFGRYNIYDVGLQTLSAVPTLAYKVNDWLSLAVGVEILYGHLYEGVKIPTALNRAQLLAGSQTGIFLDNDLQAEGHGWGVGINAAAHMRFNEQWSLGLAYKSQITLTMEGDTNFAYQGPNLLINAGKHLPNAYNGSLDGTVQLPDSLTVGLMYKPLDNLSFEVGGAFTRWSTYNALNIYMHSPTAYAAKSQKSFKDGWTVNASVEYLPWDWWALRAGFWYETPVTRESHIDFMMPTNGRRTYTIGTGFKWNDFTVDLAFAHMRVNPCSYHKTDASGILFNPASGNMVNGKTKDVSANIYMFSVGYTF